VVTGSQPTPQPEHAWPRWSALVIAAVFALTGVWTIRSLVASRADLSWRDVVPAAVGGVVLGLGAAIGAVVLVALRSESLRRFRAPSYVLVGGLAVLLGTAAPRWQVGLVSFATAFLVGFLVMAWVKGRPRSSKNK
jgi:hypothetical protein